MIEPPEQPFLDRERQKQIRNGTLPVIVTDKQYVKAFLVSDKINSKDWRFCDEILEKIGIDPTEFEVRLVPDVLPLSTRKTAI